MTRHLHTGLVAMMMTTLSACSDDSTPAADAPPAAPPSAEPAAPAPAPEAEPEPTPDPYRTQAEALVAAIDAGKTAAEILPLADELTKTGLSMLPAMIEAHPVCKTYLDAITAVGLKLRDMPIDEIESGYHTDGKLPPMPSADCYHGKDLVVHPATVSALAIAGLSTEEDRQAAKGEIVEVLGHLTAIEPGKAE